MALLGTEGPPLYQQITEEALHLNQLGMNMEAIARHLGVDGKTVAKAVSWGKNQVKQMKSIAPG